MASAAAAVGEAPVPCPACSPAGADAGPVNAVEIVGVAQPRAVRRAPMLAPAFADQVRPVAERNTNAASRTVPVVPCSQRVRARPEVRRGRAALRSARACGVVRDRRPRELGVRLLALGGAGACQGGDACC